MSVPDDLAAVTAALSAVRPATIDLSDIRRLPLPCGHEFRARMVIDSAPRPLRAAGSDPALSVRLTIDRLGEVADLFEAVVAGDAPCPFCSRVVVVSILGCARCHGDGHPDLAFLPLIHPAGVLTHWALCPTTGEPILMTVVETDG